MSFGADCNSDFVGETSEISFDVADIAAGTDDEVDWESCGCAGVVSGTFRSHLILCVKFEVCASSSTIFIALTANSIPP